MHGEISMSHILVGLGGGVEAAELGGVGLGRLRTGCGKATGEQLAECSVQKAEQAYRHVPRVRRLLLAWKPHERREDSPFTACFRVPAKNMFSVDDDWGCDPAPAGAAVPPNATP